MTRHTLHPALQEYNDTRRGGRRFQYCWNRPESTESRPIKPATEFKGFTPKSK